METVHLYYAVFSAALMAKTEPSMAQQLAYQLAYLAEHPELFGDVFHRDEMARSVKKSSIHTSAPRTGSLFTNRSSSANSPSSANNPSSTNSPSSSRLSAPPETPSTGPKSTTADTASATRHQVTQRWPINPLNHVDWLHGGRLNERWRTRQRLTPEPSVPPHHPANKTRGISPSSKGSTTPTQHISLSDALLSQINHAIMCALVQSDPEAQHKFAVGLFAYLHCQPEHLAFRSHYWLIMHAIRCFLFGTRLQWGEAYAANTEIRQSQHPMYPVIADFLSEQHNMDQTSLLKQLMAQMAFLPPILQSQCLGLGIAYRPISVDDATGSGADLLTDCFNKTALHTAVQWIRSGLEAG